MTTEQKEFTPQGLEIHSVFNTVTGQTLKYVVAVFIGKGQHYGMHILMPGIHPAKTKDGKIFDMVPGEFYPITLDRYHLAVESGQFCVPHLHVPGDGLLQLKLHELWQTQIGGDALHAYVTSVGGFLQPLNNVNAQAYPDTELPAPKG
jgi:hypothetical protein